MNLIGVATQRVGLGALLVLLPGQLFAQGQQPLPSTDEILKRVIERTRWAEAQNHRAKYTFAQTVVTEKLDKIGALDEREVKLFQVVPLEGESYSRLIKKNGQPLSEEDRKEERTRERKFRRQLAERQQGKDDDRVRIDEELLSRFRINLIRRDKVNGRPAFLLTFEPKRKDLPARRRVDRFINKFAGKFWIDEQDYELARIEARLLEPVGIGWNILGNLKVMDLEFERTKVDNAAWLPLRFKTYMKGRKLFSSVHQRQRGQWRDFQKATPEFLRTHTTLD